MARPVVIDVVATEKHFVAHTLPVWRALPPEMRGGFFTKPSLADLGEEPHSDRAGRGDLTLVCSYGDLVQAVYGDSKRPIIFMEHGAGMTFESIGGITHASYSGSFDRPNVVLFLNPNEYVRDANARAHPLTPSTIVGSPKMDRWYPVPPSPLGERPVVAFSFHWDCIISPGTRSAFDHFRAALPTLLDRGWDVIGTAHPRIETRVEFECKALGIPYVNLETVFETANLLVADATSAMYEFASLDRPVVVMNAPWYKHEADDGIRFWREMPGIDINEPATLADTVEFALTDPPYLGQLRHSAVANVYTFRGDAAERAVAAIQDFVKENR